jgi:Zn-dependent protease
VKCHLCDNEEAIPFRCRYCGRDFCSFHRLPPNHDCPLIDQYVGSPARKREFIERAQGKAGSPQERLKATVRNGLILRFSKLEMVHLVIGTALVTGVGLSLNDYRIRWDYLIVFISAFVVHEFGHKFLAQLYHAWAEFRLVLFSAAITAFSALPIMPIKFIAPGAVFIGPLSNSRHGKVAWIGPLTNLAMGGGFILAYLASALYFDPMPIFLVGARFNAWIAIFNLIPFMGLDGAKIIGWNKIVYGLTMAGAVGLFVLVDIIGGGGTLRFFGRLF